MQGTYQDPGDNWNLEQIFRSHQATLLLLATVDLTAAAVSAAQSQDTITSEYKTSVYC